MRCVVIALAALALVLPQARAETLKLAVPQRGSWGTSYSDLGIRQGFFKQPKGSISRSPIRRAAPRTSRRSFPAASISPSRLAFSASSRPM